MFYQEDASQNSIQGVTPQGRSILLLSHTGILAGIVALAATLFLIGCAGHKPADLQLLPSDHRAPDSVAALLKLTLHRDGQKKNIQCIVSALPEKRYKLDFKGTLSKHLGSFYWVADSQWVLVIPSEDKVFQGDADSIYLPLFAVEDFMLRPFLSPFWGGLKRDSSWQLVTRNGKHEYYRDPASGIFYLYRPASDRVEKAERGGYSITYSQWQGPGGKAIPDERRLKAEGKKIPGKLELRQGDDLRLEARLEKLKENPEWSRSPFFIKLP